MSSRIECVGSRNYEVEHDSPYKIDNLPQELLDQIFSYLGKIDLQSVVCVSGSISSSVKKAACINETNSMKNFIQIVIENLNVEFSIEQRELLKEIAENITAGNLENLRQLKEYVFWVKSKFVDVIKTLDVETIDYLNERVKPPHFFEGVFESIILKKKQMAALERQIERANLNLHPYPRGITLWRLSTELIQIGNIERAIVVAQSISIVDLRGRALKNVSEALMQAGNIDRAILVAESISEIILRDQNLREISEFLTQTGNIDRALVVALSISIELKRGYALRNISSALIKDGYIDRALEITQSISNLNVRKYALQDIPSTSYLSRLSLRSKN